MSQSSTDVKRVETGSGLSALRLRISVSARSKIQQSERVNRALFLVQNIAVTTRCFLRGPQIKRARPGSEPIWGLSAMVRVKDEGRFILEWIGHHVLAGIEHFYVYDNASNDNTRDVLDPLVKSGLVTYVEWPTRPITPSAEFDFFARFAAESKWVAFFDSDEFIAARSKTLPDILAEHRGPALAINWRRFGSSWHAGTPSGLVTRNFTYADRNPDRQIKVVVRTDQVAALRNPHNFYYRGGRLATTAEGVKAYGTVAQVRDELALELRHYVHRGTEDSIRKTCRAHSATNQHNFYRPLGSASDAYNRNNDICMPLERKQIRMVERAVSGLVHGVPANRQIEGASASSERQAVPRGERSDNVEVMRTSEASRSTPGQDRGAPNRVVVAICTRNRVEEANRCIGAIVGQLSTGDRILVIDNSNDGSFVLNSRLMGTGRVDVVHEPTEGYSAVRNRALDEVRDEWALIFIDDDEIADPQWLASHRQYARESKADVIFGPVVSIYPPAGDQRIAKGRLFDRPRMRTGTVRASGSTCNVLVKSDALERTSLRFDPKFNRTGGEDNDFFTKLHALGFRLEWNDEAVATEPVVEERMSYAGARDRFVRLGYARCKQLAEKRGQLYLVARIGGHIAFGSVKAAYDICRGQITPSGLRRLWSATGGIRFMAAGDRA